ncbi:rna-directed dna polymerase from mobile element jockey-like [Willisornis vidua]|uniref:Rna-directed dna polymerase from mobile element jockey-like n=1 Tax=Willisornis vidua TaxID=1566151 RepID=A0ABQ9CWA6_9PASS|nr:rna-directed dna polymerase from mobile element jockey-like [Willisornis vidua]
MEQIILSAIMQHVQYNQGIRLSQRGFVKCRPYLTNLISFCDQPTSLVGKEKALSVSYLDFSRVFDTMSNSSLEKLNDQGLDRCTVLWGGKSWTGPERDGEWNDIQLAVSPQWCSPGLNIGGSPV